MNVDSKELSVLLTFDPKVLWITTMFWLKTASITIFSVSGIIPMDFSLPDSFFKNNKSNCERKKLIRDDSLISNRLFLTMPTILAVS